jgi:hypothetical protein
MTEDEAKTKWCPMVRAATLITGVDYHETAVGGAGCNRAHPNMMFEGAVCIASDCMMWRWIDRGSVSKPIDGYCGLGGKP